MKSTLVIFLIIFINFNLLGIDNQSKYYLDSTVYFHNPGIGCLTWSNLEKQPSYLKPFLDGLYSRLSWRDVVNNGKIDFSILRSVFQEAYKYKQRIDIGIFFNLSMKKDTRYRLGLEMYNGKEVYVCYPNEIHEKLMKSKEYRPRLVYVNESDTYWYCIDWRNHIAQNEYQKLLLNFNVFLNAPWHNVTRRRYINSIQIRFWGFWGEGHNNYLITQYKNKPDVFEDSKTMIQMDRMYQKYFHDIRLIAPAMGKTSNIPDKWKEWAFYEMTAKTDVGEFGIFLDHISQTSSGDFTLNYKGIDTHNLALIKWTKAPVTGEGNIVNDLIPNREEGRVVRTDLPIEQYDIYKYHISSFLPMKRNYSSEEAAVMKSLLNIVGFRLYFQKDSVYSINNRLMIKMRVGNLGLAPVYANYWKLQIVLRDLAGRQIKVIQPNIDIKKIYPGKKMLVFDSINFEIKNILKTQPSKKAHIFLRIIDTDGISLNMYLCNEGRTINGEYQLN
ncbi:hypothetical protein Palpr_0408 [Paludibacter propionicigenes WB4]|uniref:DUF4832 domain-containing protein n=1 Tax=Paludibacter propionicigenes (strain DSM 17365 / JCM 13257 / WB4) TaxID=694427 RepID=E4T1H4_PALPW|nr:DUF4832 domain-containing protein [Paludibacter propionicigenes]ADQ78568.1 hypothetical protein Palpr_0408 [Paludibacter propionicigenes WB4]